MVPERKERLCCSCYDYGFVVSAVIQREHLKNLSVLPYPLIQFIATCLSLYLYCLKKNLARSHNYSPLSLVNLQNGMKCIQKGEVPTDCLASDPELIHKQPLSLLFLLLKWVLLLGLKILSFLRIVTFEAEEEQQSL